jgi:hypothetical protein
LQNQLCSPASWTRTSATLRAPAHCIFFFPWLICRKGRKPKKFVQYEVGMVDTMILKFSTRKFILDRLRLRGSTQKSF